MDTTLTVLSIGTLDFYLEYTQSAFNWVQTGGAWNDPVASSVEFRRDMFLAVVAAVSRHPLWECERTLDPRVSYDPVRDTAYFIFKIRNNGSTFLVGRCFGPDMMALDPNPLIVELQNGA